MIVDLRRPDSPRASIIMLAWRSPLIVPSLRAVADTGARVSFEVVVVANGAAPDVVDALEGSVRGATVVRSAVNLGFAGGCNRGAREARGEYLVFLNDDTEVEPGWLDALVDAADADPTIAAVGSRLLFPDGTLQEAGSVLWNDGSSMPIGRGERDDPRRHAFRRDVDYCSACGLLVRRSAWELAGGFDEAYFPGYYEDVDLCLRLRDAGWRVVFEPGSRIVHYESASLDSRYKHFVVNAMKRRFVQRWADHLDRYCDAEPTDPEAVRRAVLRARGERPRVLVIDDRLPNPDAGSGFSRMFDAVSDLAGAGWVVACAATDRPDANIAALSDVRAEIVEDVEFELARRSSRYDAVVISRPNNIAGHAPLVRRFQPDAALIYDAEALYHRRIGRQLEVEEDPGRRADLEAQLAAMTQIELGIADVVDRVVCVSQDEAEFFRLQAPDTPVSVLPPRGRHGSDVGPGFYGRRDAIFVAGWLAGADSPNGDGLRWFVSDILHRVTNEVPWFRVLVTGGAPPTELMHLAGPHLTFLGHVEDLGDLYRRARLAIAPIRYGAGVKIKTVEALSFGLPVVATTCAAEGIPGIGSIGAVVTDDPIRFARAVIELVEDERMWAEQRRAALERPAAHPSDPGWPDILMADRPTRPELGERVVPAGGGSPASR
jgi:GT2 family glycosyltransferase